MELGECHIQRALVCVPAWVCVFQREIYKNHRGAPHGVKFLIFVFVQRTV